MQERGPTRIRVRNIANTVRTGGETTRTRLGKALPRPQSQAQGTRTQRLIRTNIDKKATAKSENRQSRHSNVPATYVAPASDYGKPPIKYEPYNYQEQTRNADIYTSVARIKTAEPTHQDKKSSLVVSKSGIGRVEIRRWGNFEPQLRGRAPIERVKTSAVADAVKKESVARIKTAAPARQDKKSSLVVSKSGIGSVEIRRWGNSEPQLRGRAPIERIKTSAVADAVKKESVARIKTAAPTRQDKKSSLVVSKFGIGSVEIRRWGDFELHPHARVPVERIKTKLESRSAEVRQWNYISKNDIKTTTKTGPYKHQVTAAVKTSADIRSEMKAALVVSKLSLKSVEIRKWGSFKRTKEEETHTAVQATAVLPVKIKNPPGRIRLSADKRDSLKAMLQTSLRQQGDSGACTLSLAVDGGAKGKKIFKASQWAVNQAIKRIERRRQIKLNQIEKPKLKLESVIKGTAAASKISLNAGGRAALRKVRDASGDVLNSSDDLGIQALNLGMGTAKRTVKVVAHTPRVARKTYKVARATVLAPVKAGKRIYRTSAAAIRAVKITKAFGIKVAVRYFRNKAIIAAAKVIGKVANAVINLIANLAGRYVIPLLLIIAAVAAVMNMVAAPVSAVGVVFGGVFSNTSIGEDVDVKEFLAGWIDVKRREMAEELLETVKENLVDNDGEFHYVRIFVEGDEAEIEQAEQSILNVIYSVNELAAIIEPLFKTIALADYGLEMSQDEIDDILNDTWDTIFRITQDELPVEYCEDAHLCGEYHANVEECPNLKSGAHATYICDSCCVNTPSGPYCNGYINCEGHKILGITIELGGIYELLHKYYMNPIDELANLSSRTVEEEERLQLLRDSLELCLIYIDEVQSGYGSGSDFVDTGNIPFVDGDRPGNSLMVAIAEAELGNVGGYPYWRWYGFSSRVEWCACFVSWVAEQAGYIQSGVIPKFASCVQGVKWFQSRGLWTDNNYLPSAGDIIFFDWDNDGLANHVGIVVGTDGEYVYTIEGNSGDVCRSRKYSLTSSVVLGYGLPNY